MRLLTRPAEAEAALEQEPTESGQGVSSRLRLPHGLKSAKFAAAVGLILAAGLVGLLIVNTSLAAGAIKLSGIESKLARTIEQRQALEVEVEGLASPAALQVAAAALGMVPATSPVFLDPATGTVHGALGPAEAPAEPFVPAPQFAARPEPTAIASPGPTDGPQPSGASPGPVPSVTPTPPADSGPDGASVVQPTSSPSPSPSPSAATTPELPDGDSATVVDPEVD